MEQSFAKEQTPRETVSKQETAPKGILKFLYYTKFGAFFLKPITARWVSKVAGRYLDSRFSRHKIKGYVKKHRIDMSQYETENYP